MNYDPFNATLVERKTCCMKWKHMTLEQSTLTKDA